MKQLTQHKIIENKIFLIRGKKVMLDRDLAELYGVQAKVLTQAVKRNRERFPVDFMFQLNRQETKNLRSQSVTLEQGRYSKYQSRVFTEQGVAMLSSVLNSKRAILVNIQIMRTFTKLREMLQSNAELRRKIEGMEATYDHQFQIVFKAIKKLLTPPRKPKRQIGFHANKNL